MSTSETTTVVPHEHAHEEETTYCAVHPDRETALRCNRCGRYMCVECAVQTPVGYRCRECVRGIEDKFYTATSNDYLSAAGICGLLTAAATALIGFVSLPLLFILILGLPAGGAISEAGLRVSKRRRGRQSGLWAAAGAVGGGLVGAFIQTFIAYSAAFAQIAERYRGNVPANVPRPTLDLILRGAFDNIGVLLFIAIVAFAVYSRFKVRI